MHFIILLLLAGVILVLMARGRSHTQSANSPAASLTTAIADFAGQRLAFVSRGKLFYKDGNSEVDELQSPYVQGIKDRLERSRKRHGWKKGTAFETSFAGRKSNVPDEETSFRFAAAQFMPSGSLLYSMHDDAVGGLFEYDFGSKEEKRLLHEQRLVLDDLCLDAAGERLLCSSQDADGTASVGLLDVNGDNYRDLTGGDTVDSAPVWVTGEPDNIVFQSCGVARSEDGFVIAMGPSSLQMLDIRSGDLSAVKEDDDNDFLHPKVTSNGSLLFIRRPFEAPRYNANNFLLDFLMFPFRLGRAVFHYLNFFSLMYTRKPLTSASGPEVQADLKDILVKGKRIDAQNALRRENRVNGVQSLVPSSWQLVERTRNGTENILATNVAAFDITQDGTLVYTNGFGVFVRDAEGGDRVLMRDKLIADIVVR